MMTTPICDFVKEYAEKNAVRLHMPGHKGQAFLGPEAYDITEFDGADTLYSAGGIIKESEANAASLFGTGLTKYSVEGSSLSIRAMLYLALLFAKKSGRKPLVAAGRNAHKTLVTAAALLDFDIMWLYDASSSVLSCKITAESFEVALNKCSELPCALYITSPDYLGNITDISALSAVCKRHGILLLVDNAHGAYLNFLSDSRHPIALGADMVCDSAHKTLPVLTGGGYLHISKTAPEICRNMAEQAMAMFASTSPSYLILASLDAANRYIADGYRERLSALCTAVSALKESLKTNGYTVTGDEPTKLTLMPKSYGYTGEEIAEVLYSKGIVCEFYDSDHVVMMFTPETPNSSIERLEREICSIQKRKQVHVSPPVITEAKRAMSIREAAILPSEEISVCEAVGRVLAGINVSCPPAVPVAVLGEIIDESAVAAFRYYGIFRIRVVKQN